MLAQDTKTFGEVEYYGYAGIDLPRLRLALPIHVGDPITAEHKEEIKAQVRAAVLKVVGRPATDVETICCDAQGHILLYIGLPGTNYRPSSFYAPPTGRTRLPGEAYDLYQQDMEAMKVAVDNGSAIEDDAQGYAVMGDPNARRVEMAVRAYAVRHTPVIIRTLRGSADAGQRAAAAVLLGYAEATPEQIGELVRATDDPDDDVRDEAIRALGVLANSKLAVGRRIPAGRFIAMLNSGVWTDRNKAAFLLSTLSSGRNPALLRDLRAKALASLVEMARWDAGHAGAACLILAHIAGMSDRRALSLAAAGTPEPIISAARAAK